MGDTPSGVGSGDRLMKDGRRLGRRGNGFRKERDVTEQKIGLGGLDVIRPLELARHVAGQRQNRGVIAAGFIKPRHQMRAAGTGRAVSFACPAAASAAPSSWRTPIHSMLLLRTASARGLSESPINPNICFTPTCSSTRTKTSATVCDILYFLATVREFL
jgi:hypothetical protein